MPNVLYVCPTYFSPDSVVAGAERYSFDLARAMSRRAPTTLLTFGDEAFTRRVDNLTIKCARRLAYVKNNRMNPLSFEVLREVRRADVVHCLQYRTVVTDLAVLGGAALRKAVFATDLGGGTDFSFAYRVPLHLGLRAFLMISEYNRALWRTPTPSRVIFGGVDEERFVPPSPTGASRARKALFVGRLLRGKGLDTLIQAAGADLAVDVVGRAYEPQYFEQLRAAAADTKVSFDTTCADDALVRRYQEVAVTVIPVNVDGGYTTALESMASGTPVIATRVGSLPELVVDGETGYLVPPDDPSSLRERMRELLSDPKRCAEMGARGRDHVLSRFTWNRVVDRCLDAYEGRPEAP